MELIRISDQKMKIMLTPADMTQYDISDELLESDSEQVHRVFRLLLDDIRKQTGFALDDRQLSVQYFPSREGGCEMFVSSIAPSPHREEKKRPTAKTTRAITLKPEKTVGKTYLRESAYRFENMETLLRVCKRLSLSGYAGESAAYSNEKKNCFLFLRTLSDSPFTLPEEFSFLSEYGCSENATMLKLYLREHGTALCRSHAVETLAKLG